MKEWPLKEETLKEQPLFQLVGLEFKIAEYECIFNEVVIGKDSAEILIHYTNKDKVYHATKLELDLIGG